MAYNYSIQRSSPRW